ncbi:hypothetical protein [Tissierella sp.]
MDLEKRVDWNENGLYENELSKEEKRQNLLRLLSLDLSDCDIKISMTYTE